MNAAANCPETGFTLRGRVRGDWIDYNGHMNVAYYVLAFDQATDAFLDVLGLDADYRARCHHTTFVLEMHVNYVREIDRDQPYMVATRVLDADHKRVHLFHEMRHASEGWLAATNELMVMHIDMEARRGADFPPDVAARAEAWLAAQRTLPWPEQAGSVIGIRR